MRLALDGAEAAPLPAGFRFAAFGERDANEVECLLVAVRADGLAGDASRQLGWFERVRRNDEWDASLVRLVREKDGASAGVAHSWTSAFLKDLAVADIHRGLGLGRALVGETARLFRARGFSSLELKVRPANTPARRFYDRLGFRQVTS